MLKRSPLKVKNAIGLKRTALKPGNSTLKSKSVLKVNTTLSKKTALKKQSVVAKDKWIEARENCLRRDGNLCQVCGEKATQVHHIILRSKRKDLLYNLNNLISLCDKHHFHKGIEKYAEQTQLIAQARNITVDELLTSAEK